MSQRRDIITSMHGETTHSILGRVISPGSGDLAPDAAEEFLRFGFTESDHERIQELADKSSAGTLSADERREYDAYLFAGELVAMLHAKARLSLRNHSTAA